MKYFVVSVDLRQPPISYSELHRKLQAMDFQQLQLNLWAGPANGTPEWLKRALMPSLLPGDGVFIFSQDSETQEFASHTRRG